MDARASERPSRRALLAAATFGVVAHTLPAAVVAASADPPTGGPDGGALTIVGASGSDGAVTLAWEDTS